jgi:hypothetical protein
MVRGTLVFVVMNLDVVRTTSNNQRSLLFMKKKIGTFVVNEWCWSIMYLWKAE